MNKLLNKKILIVICGGIAAYKSLEIIRLLKKKGSKIKVILTKNAKKFVSVVRSHDILRQHFPI